MFSRFIRAYDADDGLRAREHADDIRAMRGNIFAIHFHEAHVIRPRLQAQ
jgi:hypothetical protein